MSAVVVAAVVVVVWPLDVLHGHHRMRPLTRQVAGVSEECCECTCDDEGTKEGNECVDGAAFAVCEAGEGEIVFVDLAAQAIVAVVAEASEGRRAVHALPVVVAWVWVAVVERAADDGDVLCVACAAVVDAPGAVVEVELGWLSEGAVDEVGFFARALQVVHVDGDRGGGGEGEDEGGGMVAGDVGLRVEIEAELEGELAAGDEEVAGVELVVADSAPGAVVEQL